MWFLHLRLMRGNLKMKSKIKETYKQTIFKHDRAWAIGYLSRRVLGKLLSGEPIKSNGRYFIMTESSGIKSLFIVGIDNETGKLAVGATSNDIFYFLDEVVGKMTDAEITDLEQY